MSVLAKEIQKEFQLSQEFIQEGFLHMSKAGELIAEVESLSSSEDIEEWLRVNCPGIAAGQAKQSLRLFRGEKIRIEAYKEKRE